MYTDRKIETIPNPLIPFDTNRWTSPVYNVQFGQVSIVAPEAEQEAAFKVSAWGLSKNLRSLLKDYSDAHVREATEWLTLQQNAMVADVLEQMQYSGQAIPPLEHLFIAIDGELFLPNDGLDKFVAILDPGESDKYVIERKGVGLPTFGERIH